MSSGSLETPSIVAIIGPGFWGGSPGIGAFRLSGEGQWPRLLVKKSVPEPKFSKETVFNPTVPISVSIPVPETLFGCVPEADHKLVVLQWANSFFYLRVSLTLSYIAFSTGTRSIFLWIIHTCLVIFLAISSVTRLYKAERICGAKSCLSNNNCQLYKLIGEPPQAAYNTQ